MRVALRCCSVSAAVALLSIVYALAPNSTVFAREVVAFDGGIAAGTIVVRTGERRLYYVLGNRQALRYPVGVGRAGQQWSGRAVIDGKYIRPDWAPPPDIARDHPNLPKIIPGGSPRNPMGVAAMTLSGGEYAIHGPTIRARSAASCPTAASGCTTGTSPICTVASASARRSSSRDDSDHLMADP